MLSSSSERKILFSTYISNIPFGNISISARMKSSIGTGSTNLVEMNTYFVDASGDELVETLLDSININGYMFGVANEYVSLGMVTNYNGIATGATFLKVELIVLPDTGATLYFDQIAVAMEMRSTSGSYIDIHVEDRTIVIASGSGSSGGGSAPSKVYVEGTTIIVNK